MATIDYEKKYKEALEKARQLCAYPTTKPFISDLQDLFPELRESEDERIRKALLRFHKSSIDVDGIKGEKIIAWLEKQGEPKPWSEEDEQAIEDAETWLDELCYYLKDNSSECIPTIKEVISKLKSLKNRYTWRPSKEQMEALKYSTYCPNKQMSKVLFELYQDLKKLSEE